MNDDRPAYLPRLVDRQLDGDLAQLSAAMLVGPRAGGKTTTGRRRAATVVALDVPGRAAAFRVDPDAALRGLPEPVFLDEWQLVPEVLGAVRRSVDAVPGSMRYLLAGSIRAAIEQQLWPATGRVTRLTMYPMTVREQLGRVSVPGLLARLIAGTAIVPDAGPWTVIEYVEHVLAGGFPESALRLTGNARRAWQDSYLNDLVTRDVQALSPAGGRPRDPRRMRAYLDAYATVSAGTPNHATIFNAANINRKTAEAYEGLLTDLFLVEQVRAWSSNRLKRLVSTEKRYLLDSGLWAAAVGVDASAILDETDVLGRAIDTFAVAQLRPEAAALGARLYHLRAETGRREIDLIVECGDRRLIAFEFKADTAPSAYDARHLGWLRDEYPDRFVAGVVLHTGPTVYALGDKLLAAPLSSLWAR